MSKRIEPEIETFARIRVVGVGGSGKNAVNHMINSKVRGETDAIVWLANGTRLHYRVTVQSPADRQPTQLSNNWIAWAPA